MSDAVKKSMLRAVGGPDGVWLCDQIGRVSEEMTYKQAVEAIRRSITGQTSQSAMRFKLFTGMQQGLDSFSNWWTKITEQADKCGWTGYNSKKAAKDTIIFQTASNKLRKKALSEDSNPEEVVQYGLALEQTENSEAMGKKEEEEKDIRRPVEEEVGRLKLKQPKKKKKSKGGCQTCSWESHDEKRECAGLRAKECFSCGKKGHFQGAPICSGKEEREEGPDSGRTGVLRG